MTVNINMIVCSVAKRHQCFWGTCCLHLQHSSS